MFMHTKTMEGLTGASINMKMLKTPYRVYKEAERKGDTSVMKQAMGYVGEFADKTKDYQKKAEEGMKEDAQEARENAEAIQQNALLKRKEKQKEQEMRIEENRNNNTDTSNTTEDDKKILVETNGSSGATNSIAIEEATDTIKKEPVIYTKIGKAAISEPGTNISVSV